MAACWWRDRLFAHRFVSDLVAAELGRSRRSTESLPPRPWPGDLALGTGGLGADSLELMALATALAEAIHLHRVGIEDALLARRRLSDWVDLLQAGLEASSSEMTFRTSGSEGTAKACTHELAALVEEVEALAGLFRNRRRVLAAVPGHHIYGFLHTILLPARLGLAGGDVVDIREATPGVMAASWRPGDLVVGHPEFWRSVGRLAAPVARDVVGTTSTAPCPDDVARSVVAAGLEALYQVYGASETAGVGWRAAHDEPYRLFPFWHRHEGPGDNLSRTALSGVPRLFQLQDDLEWLDERHFRVLGRRDSAVQVGGANVYPSRVRAVLLRHPGVLDAAVRLMRPEEGTRLKAFVVPRAGSEERPGLEADLREWIDRHLEVAERPKALRFGPALPAHPMGKAKDWPIDP